MFEVLDIPNVVITVGEYVQDIRDRDIKFLGISALAGYIEDLSKPDHAQFRRARWAALKEAVPLSRKPWQNVQGSSHAAVNRKAKDIAVIVGAPLARLAETRMAVGSSVRTWPAAAYSYRGVDRAGLLSDGFGQLEDHAAVAMLKGRSDFMVSLGLMWVKSEGFNRVMQGQPWRSDIKKSPLYIPEGVVVMDEVPIDDIPETVPLV